MIRLGLFAPAVAVILAGSGSSGKSWAGDPESGGMTADFARDIRPILARNCYECHGPEKRKGGLRLDRKAEAFAGGDSGAAIEPGKADDSELIARVTSDDPDEAMPPKGRRLSPRQVGLLRTWIDRGAPW